MRLRLTAQDDRALSLLADSQGISKEAAAVRAIREAATRVDNDRSVHDDSVRQWSARARSRYGDVLDRLGQ